MSQLQRLVWQRLGSLAMALLMVPSAVGMPIAAQALTPNQKQTACPGTELFQPNDPDVQALRSLIQKYKVADTNGVGDRPITGDEFAVALFAVVTQVRENLLREDSAPSNSDIVALYNLRERFSATLIRMKSQYGSALDSLQVLQQMTQETVGAKDVQALRLLIQHNELKAPIALTDQRTLTRYDFVLALNSVLGKLSEKLSDTRDTLSKQDFNTIDALMQGFASDLVAIGGTYNFSKQQYVSSIDILVFRALSNRYGLSVGLPTVSPVRSMTRYEFAAGLNALLDRVNELIASGNASLVSKADLTTLQRLQEAYAPELATLRGRVDALEARTSTLERQQFSTTTKLSGEVIFPVSAPAPAAPSVPPAVRPMPPIGDISGAIAPAKPSPAQPSSPVPVFSDQSRINQPGTGNTEGYNAITENAFLRPSTNPLSTFSIDVDTASYSNVRRFINAGQLPPKDAVRLEELINYFPYDYPQPERDKPFSVTTDVAAAPWNPKHKLVQIGLKGKQLQTLQPSNLVFLVDVSGSMDEPNKLPLVKRSLCLLVNELTAQDRVTLVVYAGNAGLVLPPTPGDRKQTILDAIDRLEAGGSTAGGAGIELAYKLAQQSFIKDGNNRVILSTDGDFNVGVSSDAELVRLIEQKRDRGIFLTVLGFGTGNTKDSKMEQLADKGNGNYAYIDTLPEAKKVLVNDLRSTLFTIAKDVKIQVEFNPAKVQAYRLIGYENRLLQDQDFNDDKKDAGEIGAGRTVTALYEIIPTGIESDTKLPSVDPLKYQQPNAIVPASSNEIMQVKLRYKNPKDSTSQLLSHSIFDQNTPLEATSNNLKFSAAVAMFGMVLRESEFKGQANFDAVLRLAKQAKGNDPNGYRAEFIQLVDRCKTLLAQTQKTDRRASNDVSQPDRPSR